MPQPQWAMTMAAVLLLTRLPERCLRTLRRLARNLVTISHGLSGSQPTEETREKTRRPKTVKRSHAQEKECSKANPHKPPKGPPPEKPPRNARDKRSTLLANRTSPFQPIDSRNWLEIRPRCGRYYGSRVGPDEFSQVSLLVAISLLVAPTSIVRRPAAGPSP